MRMLKILFLCTGNSCRSIMAEAILNHYGKDRFHAISAGSFPTGEVNSWSLQTIHRHALPIIGYRSKSWDEFINQPIDIVITVCDQAGEETCPIFPGSPIKAHWSTPDPAHFKGCDILRTAEFERVFSILKQRIQAMLRLPLETMARNEITEKLNYIGTL